MAADFIYRSGAKHTILFSGSAFGKIGCAEHTAKGLEALAKIRTGDDSHRTVAESMIIGENFADI